MNYQDYILNEFIDKYERGADYRKGNTNCRVLLNMDMFADLQNRMENTSEKEAFFQVLSNLEKKNIIEIVWAKYEVGNRIHKLYLKDINAAYRLLKRQPKQNAVDQFNQLLKKYISAMTKSTPLRAYLEEVNKNSDAKRKIPVGFDDDLELDGKILKFFVLINGNTQEQMERVLSVSLYKDSKCFERTVKAKALIILRQLQQKQNEEKIEDADLLQLYGVTRWPEIMEFCGNLCVTMDDEKQIIYQDQIYGSYVNSEMIAHMKRADVSSIDQIMFIENKANYVWYISNKKKHDELVIYHGGVYSPSKGKWFQLIKDGLKKNTAVYHWSDIDAGGFRIFTRLNNNIFEEAKPYCMDVDTLMANKSKCIPLGSEHYKKILQRMAAEDKYASFRDTIQYMLKNDVKLEQENLIDKI